MKYEPNREWNSWKTGENYANVYFCKDIESINAAFNSIKDTSSTSADLLIEFLKFYGYTFNPYKQMISISSRDGPILEKEKFLQLIKN